MRLRPKFISALFIFVLLAVSGCSGLPGSYAYKTDGQSYFYGEFDDIRIPAAMNNCAETTVITTPNNIKTGVQVFTGQVEVNSLIRAINSYLHNDGWTLRAATRSGKSLNIYDKTDRYCALYFIDGSIFTEMQIFVIPKLTTTQQAPASGNAVTAPSGVNLESPASSFDSQSFNN